MKWSPELVIAIIGALTGISSLSIQFFDFWKTRPNIDIELSDNIPSFYIWSKKFQISADPSYEHSKINVLLNLNIRNLSVNPITIERIDIISRIKPKSKFLIRNDLYKNIWRYYINTDKKSYYVYNFKEPLTTPKRLDGYDTLQGNLKIPFFSEENMLNGVIPLTINLVTTKKTIRKDVDLNVFHSSY